MDQLAARSGAFAVKRRSPRDPRIDVLRGLALMMIFIDHVPENLYSFYTIRMIGFSDAAEAFVLISGISAGLAYSHKFLPGSMLETAIRIWKRGLTIYGAHIVSTVLALAITIPVIFAFGMTEFAETNGIDWVWRAPFGTLLGIFALSYQVSYFNILPLYVALFLAVPGLLWLGKRSIAGMLVVAAIIWLVARQFDTLPAHPGDWAWYFNPFCWLLLFAIGLAVGIARREGRKLVPFSVPLYGACIAFVVFAAVWRFTGHFEFPFPPGTPAAIADTSKETLGLPRIAHILALAYIVIYLPGLRGFLEHRLFWPLNVMGRASLVTFVTGSLIAFSLQLFRLIVPTGVLEDTILLAIGIVVQFLAARYALSRAGRL